MPVLRHSRLFGLIVPLLFVACSGSGDGDNDDDNPPPPPPVTSFPLDAADPCAQNVPLPTDLFINDDGTTERSACALPADPLEAGIEDAQRNLGAAVDAEIRIPVTGTLDALTLSSSVTFALRGTETGGPPPVVLLEQTGASTAAADWAVIGADVRFVEGDIVVRPRAPLAAGAYHVVVTTQSIRNAESPQGHVVTAPAVALVVGAEEIIEGAYEGLDAITAQRLERERLRLAPIVALLAAGSPPIPAEKIASIQGFTTDPGYGRFERLVTLYYDAIEEGRYGFTVETAVVSKPEVFIGVPPAAYANVNEVHYGTLKAPKILGEDGRIRPNWHLNKEEINIPFSFSVPVGSARYPVVVFLPGFGRGKIDVRSLAQEYAGGPQAAVMTIDMRCHGDRSPEPDGFCVENRTAQEIADLQDVSPNNGNMEVAGSDGIPDDSGVGWFSGDGVALRDSQMSAAIELLHVLRALRDANNFDLLNPNSGNIHVVAQGYMAPIAALALAETQDPTARFTLSMPAGGADYRELITNGPSDLRGAWINTLPRGLTEATSGPYFDFVEEHLLAAVDLEQAGAKLRARLVNGTRFERVLLPHGRTPTWTSEAARQSLIDQIGIPQNRVSRHAAPCDDFFLFVCNLGENPTWMAEARRQLVTFMDTGGVTVTPPGQ